MIVRKKFQCRGAIRIVLGAGGLLFVFVAMTMALQRPSEAVQYLPAAFLAAISALLFVSGVHSRSKPPVFRVDALGFDADFASEETRSVLWQDVELIRQCGDQLTLVTTDGQSHAFDCQKLSHNIATISAECLNCVRRTKGMASIRETILETPPQLYCQKCGKPTSSLKDSLFLVLVFAYVYIYAYRSESMTCPGCTRRSMYKSAIINLPLANVIWPIAVLPLCGLQWLKSFRPGHSPFVIDLLVDNKVKELTA